jgi:type III secretory pathway component EscR
MKKALIFIFLLAALISKAQNNSANEKLILGKWEYNVAYDTIAAIDTADFYKPFEQREKVMFFMEIKIKKSTATYLKIPKNIMQPGNLKTRTNFISF